MKWMTNMYARVRCNMYASGYEQFGRKNLLAYMVVTFATLQLLISALNAEAPRKAVVCFGEEEGLDVKWMKKWMKKKQKGQQIQQFGRKDLLLSMFVTLDTIHLLMSTLNALAS